MTASSSHTTPMETEAISKIATIEDELKSFKLQSYHADRFPSFIQDLDSTDDPIRRAVNYITDVGIEMEKYEEYDQVQSLKESLPEIIELERQIRTQKHIFQDLATRIRTQPVSDVVEAYQKEFRRENAKHQVLSAKKKYNTHDYYREFRQAVWDVKHSNEPLPPDSDDDDADDDIVVNSVRLTVTCPITTIYLEEPVTSRVCKHTFSKHAIMELMKQTRGRLPCPVTGCGKVLKQQDLYEDTIAERRVARIRNAEASQRQTQDFYDVE